MTIENAPSGTIRSALRYPGFRWPVLPYALLVLHRPRRATRAVPAPRPVVADAVAAR
jgi:hypothetical protein